MCECVCVSVCVRVCVCVYECLMFVSTWCAHCPTEAAAGGLRQDPHQGHPGHLLSVEREKGADLTHLATRYYR